MSIFRHKRTMVNLFCSLFIIIHFQLIKNMAKQINYNNLIVTGKANSIFILKEVFQNFSFYMQFFMNTILR